MSQFSNIKNTYLQYFKSDPRNHAVIEGVGLVAQNDPTLLFVNSGMFPLVPYLSGNPHPMGKRITNVQRCIRTDVEDFEEIGDRRHTTVFNMLGNWSLGDYFKKEQINWVLDLYVNNFGLDIDRIYVSVFEGNESAPKDIESIEIWKEAFKRYGIDAKFSDNPNDVIKNFDKEGKLTTPIKNVDGLIERIKIFPFPEKKNWWKRGYAPGELGGPDSELFFDLGKESEEYEDPNLNINSDNNRFLEIGNSVFMQYTLSNDLKWIELPQKNVDFGGGLERVMFAQENMKSGVNNIFETEIFKPIIQSLENITGKKYAVLKSENGNDVKSFRIISDHIRASVLLIGDGVIPSNKEHGYILRRFIRRAIRYGINLGINENFLKNLALDLIDSYTSDEPQLLERKEIILEELDKEETKFRKTLENGLKELDKITNENLKNGKEIISAKEVFTLYESFGFPIELTLEEIKRNNKLSKEWENKINTELNDLKKSHQDLSRLGAEKKFKGGLADTSEITTALHTTHHLLLAALQQTVSKDIHQKGSNITSERLRLDFNYPEKLTGEQLQKLETTVNDWLNNGFEVNREDIKKVDAIKLGAEMEFGKNYGEIVSVYMIKNRNGEIISKEFCGGPHVKNSSDILKFGKFKILKEEASSSGIRRIKANLG